MPFVYFFAYIFSAKSRDWTFVVWKFIEHNIRHLAEFKNYFLSQQNIFVNCPGPQRKFDEKNSSKSSRPL